MDLTLIVGTFNFDGVHLTEFLKHLLGGEGRALQAVVFDLDLAGLRRRGSFRALLDGLLGEANVIELLDNVGLADKL